MNRLAQRPLPKHNDMDASALASAKPHGCVPKPVNQARGRLESFTTKQAIDSGRGVGGGRQLPPGATLGDVGVSKKSSGRRAPRTKPCARLCLACRRARTATARASKKPGQYYEHPSKGNIEVGGVGGLVAKSEAQFDGIFDENRPGPGHRPTAESHMHFEGACWWHAGRRRGRHLPARGRGQTSQAGLEAGRLPLLAGHVRGRARGKRGRRRTTASSRRRRRKLALKRATAAHVDAYGSGVDKSAGASSMSWAAEASRGRGGRSTGGGRGLLRGGRAHARRARRQTARLEHAGGATFQTQTQRDG